jgi:hypothetical protein
MDGVWFYSWGQWKIPAAACFFQILGQVRSELRIMSNYPKEQERCSPQAYQLCRFAGSKSRVSGVLTRYFGGPPVEKHWKQRHQLTALGETSRGSHADGRSRRSLMQSLLHSIPCKPAERFAPFLSRRFFLQCPCDKVISSDPFGVRTGLVNGVQMIASVTRNPRDVKPYDSQSA